MIITGNRSQKITSLIGSSSSPSLQARRRSRKSQTLVSYPNDCFYRSQSTFRKSVYKCKRKERLTLCPGNPSTSIFHFNKEDHTLGNLLRDQLRKNRHVVFSAYKIPHPLFRYLPPKSPFLLPSSTRAPYLSLSSSNPSCPTNPKPYSYLPTYPL